MQICLLGIWICRFEELFTAWRKSFVFGKYYTGNDLQEIVVQVLYILKDADLKINECRFEYGCENEIWSFLFLLRNEKNEYEWRAS